jgi:hypothetical protein
MNSMLSVTGILVFLAILAAWCAFWFCVGWAESAHERGDSALWFLQRRR